MTQAKARQTIFADTGNRAVALLLDLLPPAFAAGAAAEAGLPGAYLFPLFAFVYFAGMPLSALQGTLGKWICRIRLCDRDGGRLSWRASALRAGATMCWFAIPILLGDFTLGGTWLAAIWWLLFALPWAPVGFLPRRESLFDLLAGSLVVRYGADAESVAGSEPAQLPGVSNVAGAVLLCVVVGAFFSVAISAQRDMNRRARVSYAIVETGPLRQKVEAFHARERRWPTAGELGVPEWTPYPDGGGYRLLADGSIVVTFTVLPELKGHSITFRPAVAEGKAVRWQCSIDAGFKPAYVPASCR